MNDHEILRHLLSLEAEAAALVNDAQAEADRRVSGEERQNRLLYEEIYAKEAGSLEASYVENIAAVKAGYQKQLDDYRESLKSASIDIPAFNSLAEKLLVVKER